MFRCPPDGMNSRLGKQDSWGRWRLQNHLEMYVEPSTHDRTHATARIPLSEHRNRSL